MTTFNDSRRESRFGEKQQCRYFLRRSNSFRSLPAPVALRLRTRRLSSHAFAFRFFSSAIFFSCARMAGPSEAYASSSMVTFSEAAT